LVSIKHEQRIKENRETVVSYCVTAALQQAEMNGGVLRCDGGNTVSRDERRVLGFFRRIKEEERILKF